MSDMETHLQVLFRDLRRLEANLLLDGWYDEIAASTKTSGLFAEVKSALDDVRTTLWRGIQASSAQNRTAFMDLLEKHRLQRSVELLRTATNRPLSERSQQIADCDRNDETKQRSSTILEDSMKHVLVVDDDRIVNVLITRELQKQGHAVLMAYDPVQAATTMSRSRVDLVIVDVMMPGGSAFDVIKRMKISTRLGPIPIIAISSGMTHELCEQLMQHGADRCLKKPLDLESLSRAIRDLLPAEDLQIAGPEMAIAGNRTRMEIVKGAS